MACCVVVMCWLRFVFGHSSDGRHEPLPQPLAMRLGRHWKLWLALLSLTEIGVGLLIVAVVIDAFRSGSSSATMTMVGGEAGSTFGLTVALLVALLVGGAVLFARAAAPTPAKPAPTKPVPTILAACGLLGLAVAFLPVVRAAAVESHIALMAQLMLVLVAAPVLISVAVASVRNAPLMPAAVVRVGAPLAAVGYVGVLYLWHLPRLHESALSSPNRQLLELASLAMVGLVLWGLVLGDRRPELVGTRLAAVFVAAIPSGLLGLTLILSPQPLFAGAMTLPWGISPLADQRLSGIVMMLADLAFILPLAGWVAAAAPRAVLNRRPRVTV